MAEMSSRLPLHRVISSESASLEAMLDVAVKHATWAGYCLGYKARMEPDGKVIPGVEPYMMAADRALIIRTDQSGVLLQPMATFNNLCPPILLGWNDFDRYYRYDHKTGAAEYSITDEDRTSLHEKRTKEFAELYLKKKPPAEEVVYNHT